MLSNYYISKCDPDGKRTWSGNYDRGFMEVLDRYLSLSISFSFSPNFFLSYPLMHIDW